MGPHVGRFVLISQEGVTLHFHALIGALFLNGTGLRYENVREEVSNRNTLRLD